MLFDADYYIEINLKRWAVAERLLDQLPELHTCLDVGCGPGWFSARLAARGLAVLALDGRAELIEEARRRTPSILFSVANVQSLDAMAAIPAVDIVFCFGLLYHLENPFAAIRNLRRCTRKHLLIETQILPASEPYARLISEGRNETQGLDFHSLVLSRAALVKMLFVAGFRSVERYVGDVDHEDFQDTPAKKHRREIFLIGDLPAGLPNFETLTDPVSHKIDYQIR